MIRGIVTSVVEGVIKRFSASGRSDESIDNREYLQHYGFTSRPKAGAEIIILREGGQFLAIASDDRRYRISLENGEVALYTDEGDKIHLKRDRIIEIIGGEKIIASTKVAEITATTSTTINSPLVTVVASTKVVLDTPLTELTGNLVVAGGITSSGTYGASNPPPEKWATASAISPGIAPSTMVTPTQGTRAGQPAHPTRGCKWTSNSSTTAPPAASIRASPKLGTSSTISSSLWRSKRAAGGMIPNSV